MKVTIDNKSLLNAFRRAPDVFIKEIDKGAKEGLVNIQRESRRLHRFKSRSGNLARSVQIDFKSFKESRHGIKLESGIATYGPYIHEGFKSWKPDRFLYQAADRGKGNLMNKINNGVRIAIGKLGLK